MNLQLDCARLRVLFMRVGRVGLTCCRSRWALSNLQEDSCKIGLFNLDNSNLFPIGLAGIDQAFLQAEKGSLL